MIPGPIFQLTILGQRIVVLNDIQSATEGMTNRHLADRPKFVVAGELMDFTRVSRSHALTLP